MKQKQTFKSLLAGSSIFILLLPVFAALNSFMTESLNHSGWWRPIQDFIVPWQAKMVASTLSPFGIDSRITSGSLYSSFYMIKDGTALPVYLSWNCLGWQSALLLVISFLIGLSSDFSNISRVKCIIFGLTGTLLVNIFRMSLIAIGIYYVNSLAAQIIHDYFAAFITLLWLVIFWWFSYKYILSSRFVVENTERFDSIN